MTRAISILHCVVALALIYSSLLHFMNPYLFLDNVLQYHLLSVTSAIIVSVLLPPTSFVVALALLLGVWRQAAVAAAAMLFGVFSFVQWKALASGLPISCGCFGSSVHEITPVSASIVTVTALALGATWHRTLRLEASAGAA